MCSLEHQDIRNQLKRSRTIKQKLRISSKFLTIHWNGPPTISNELLQIIRDAEFHVDTRKWDGLSYHYVIGNSGIIYWCRDQLARLNHSGHDIGNAESYAVLMLVGQDQDVSSLALMKLKALIADLRIEPRHVIGHQEWPRATDCPGPFLNTWLNNYRSNYQKTGNAKTIVNANVRRYPNVNSQIVKTIKYGLSVSGTWILGEPVKGDCQWLKIADNQFIHASTLKEV